MEIAQEREWAEAQKIELSVDMASATKRHLQFLAAVDKAGRLYDGPALLKAVYRYNACWLPLLAKHTETPLCGEEALVVPLDCEWIWHCHRLNPVRYISDCKELFGRLLDNRHVISSSVEGHSKKKSEKIWSEMFPEEPYELDFSRPVVDDAPLKSGTDYDLVSAVERQSSFYWQVSRPHMSEDLFLKESVARYKAFLYLMKKNMESSAMVSCVPTYDIDLIWHTHQLHPFSYSKDLIRLLGKVVEHDDTDSDRSEGNALNVSFKQTAQQWEDMFGRSYWRAGAMYRGTAPIPKGSVTPKPIIEELMEVMVEVNGVRPIPKGAKQGDLFVSFSKKQPDKFFTNSEGIILSIGSMSGEKEVALFWCEPTGDLLFELKARNTSSSQPLGSASLSLGELLAPVSELSMRKWIELAPPTPQNMNYEPIFLHVGVSFTPPTPATPEMLQMLQHQASFLNGTADGSGSCSGKCSGKCKGMPAAGVGGGGSCSGKCSGKCKGTPAVGVGGGGSCSGKCSGKCKGIPAAGVSGGGSCSGKCKGIPAVGVGGGGSCSGKCSGKCKGIPAVGVAGGGSCSGKCSGKCKGIPAVGVGGGGSCSGKCSGKCKGIPAVGVGGGGSCSGKCSGKCKGVPSVAFGGGGGKFSGKCKGSV